MFRSLSFFALVSGLAAQQFAPSGGRTPAELPAGQWSLLALADCDGDGDQASAANDSFTNQFVVLRRGAGSSWTSLPLFPGYITAAAWADFDGDGDLDLLVGATGSPAPAPFGILRNDGATFPWLGQAPSALSGSIRRFAIGDVDGDLRPDVVMGLATGVQMVRNLGSNTFGNATVLSNGSEGRPALFDRDGDGDLDLAIASAAGVSLFDNSGGVFAPSSSMLPAGTAGSEVAAADFDGDGRVDLAFAHGGTIDLLWNQSTGWVLAAGAVPAGDSLQILLCGDLDRDGDADLAAGTQTEADWFRNDGNGAWSRLPALRHGTPWNLAALALGDAAARGARDLVGAFGDGQVRTMYSAAPQPFLDPQALPAPAGPSTNNQGTLVVGDVDGDGRPDMISPMGREVLHDDGRGRFSRRPIPGARPGYQEGWLADLDGDGDLDLVLGSTNTPQPPFVPLQRFVNDGLGNFTPAQDIPIVGLDGFRFGDLDGDGDVDMIAPTSFGRVAWFQNVGNGTLIDSGALPSIPGGTIANALVFEDFDGDGDRDLVGTQVGSTLPVYFNNGQGVFTANGSLSLTPSLYAWDVQAADLDGDGAIDVAVLESGALAWFRNNGTGSFTRVAGAFPAGSIGNGFAFADIDEDGDLDLDCGGTPQRLLQNDGSGHFTGANSLLWSPVFGQARFADIDEDGDVDFLAKTNNGWLRVIDRVRAAETLQVVRPGGAVQVRFFVQPQAPVAGAMVATMASIGPGPSTSFAGIRGRFLLNPATTVVLGLEDASSGTVTSGFVVPALPGLLGLDLCMQGLAFGPGLTTGFTNVVDERILP